MGVLEKILRKVLASRGREYLIGDWLEIHSWIAEEKNVVSANLWLVFQIIKSIPGIIIHSFIWGGIMFFNAIKISFRNFLKYKIFSFINVFGLTIGLAVFLLIYLWIEDELSFDKFHKDADDICRIISKSETEGKLTLNARSPDPLGPLLKENYPEVRNFTRYQSFESWVIKSAEKTFTNDIFAVADPAFFKMFSFKFINGNPENALPDLNSIIITKSMAEKYFGDQDPIGQTLTISKDYQVSGIIADIPENSHLKFDCMVHIKNMERYWGWDFNAWKDIAFYSYLQLQPGTDLESFNEKIENEILNNDPKSIAKIYLQPLNKVHLYSDYEWDLDNYKQGDIRNIWIFGFIAMSVLLIASLNFISLSTARAVNRIKEITVKKMIGAGKKELVFQFLIETFFITIVSLFISVFIVKLVLPFFNEISGKNLLLKNDAVSVLVILCILTTIISGIYPALYLSSLRPLFLFSQRFVLRSQSKSSFRKILVGAQFVLTISFLIITLTINRQMDYINQKDLGFDKNQIVYFSVYPFDRDFESKKQILLQHPNIIAVTKSIPPNNLPFGTRGIDWEGKDPQKDIWLYRVSIDYDYLKTFNITLQQGRFFEKELVTDTSSFIINQTAARIMGFENPVGKTITSNNEGRIVTGQVIGIIRDFHHSSLHNKIEPLVFTNDYEAHYLCIKIKSVNIDETLAFLKMQWEKYDHLDRPFLYSFLDETINSKYQSEEKLIAVIDISTLLCLSISCLGLYGLISFIIVQKTKEIGIRKVLGASNKSLIYLISKQFLSWILLANLIAWPIAYYINTVILENYAYRIQVTLDLFVMAGAGTFVLAIVVTVIQTISAAMENPVKTLKYE